MDDRVPIFCGTLGVCAGAILVVQYDGWSGLVWFFGLYLPATLSFLAGFIGGLIVEGLLHWVGPGSKARRAARAVARKVAATRYAEWEAKREEARRVAAEKRAEQERRERQARATLDYWEGLAGKGVPFEEAVAKLFRELGHAVRTTAVTGDGGVDLFIDGAPAQCKAYSKPVGVGAMREFASVVTDHGREGVFFALNGVTSGAAGYASRRRIRVVTARQLASLQLKLNRTKEKDCESEHQARCA